MFDRKAMSRFSHTLGQRIPSISLYSPTYLPGWPRCRPNGEADNVCIIPRLSKSLQSVHRLVLLICSSVNTAAIPWFSFWVFCKRKTSVFSPEKFRTDGVEATKKHRFFENTHVFALQEASEFFLHLFTADLKTFTVTVNQ